MMRARLEVVVSLNLSVARVVVAFVALCWLRLDRVWLRRAERRSSSLVLLLPALIGHGSQRLSCMRRLDLLGLVSCLLAHW